MNRSSSSSSLSLSIVDSADMFSYANDVPSPPVNFRFTRQQKIQIEQFFKEKKYLNSPNFHLDLYQAAIVAICKATILSTTKILILCLSISFQCQSMHRML